MTTFTLNCPLPISDYPNVLLAHGSGGKLMHRLIDSMIAPAFSNPALGEKHDGAAINLHGGRVAFTTDSYVVKPLFFPGSDIGALAINGTVNDLAMCGARPLYLSLGLILEEGLPMETLQRIIDSMRAAAQAADVQIVTGDTKVVERGKGDGVFITTTGVGVVPPGVNSSASRARPGDAILLSGSLGDHGMAVMAQRENLSFDAPIASDTAALHGLVAAMVAVAPELHCLRDPTRGGLGSALNEIAQQSGVGMRLREAAIPVHEPVRALCEFLGLDPLYVANEGKLLAICPAECAERLLAAMRAHPLGQEAAIIGSVAADAHGFVEMETVFGGRRLVDWLSGEQLPRIC